MITKSELIEKLALKQNHLAYKDIELSVKSLLEQMSHTLASGDRIEIRGFGSFSLHYRPARVGTLVQSGFDVFLDLKFHDIPNTVAAACSAAARLGIWMMNIHASGGMAMMQSARSAIECVTHPPRLIAVTMLTSLNQDDIES